MSRAVPTIMQWDSEFWAGTEVGQLLAQQCDDCGHLQHYPRPACGACLSQNREWIQLSGRGKVYSYTIVRQVIDPAFASDTPFVMLDVELEEGIRLVSRLAEVGRGSEDVSVGNQEEGSIAIGDTVEVVFVSIPSAQMRLPYFKRSSSSR